MATEPGPVCIKNGLHSSMLLSFAEKTPKVSKMKQKVYAITWNANK